MNQWGKGGGILFFSPYGMLVKKFMFYISLRRQGQTRKSSLGGYTKMLSKPGT